MLTTLATVWESHIVGFELCRNQKYLQMTDHHVVVDLLAQLDAQQHELELGNQKFLQRKNLESLPQRNA